MRKKILAAVLAATMPEVMGVSGKKADKKVKDIKVDESIISENISESVVSEAEIVEVITEEVEIAETMPEEVATTEVMPEEVETAEAMPEEVETAEATIEEVAIPEVIIEEATVEETVTQENVLEQPLIEENRLRLEIERMLAKEKNKFKYDFEGKYWIRYSEYGHIGWYFDGSKATGGMEGQGLFYRDYFVDGELINISGQWYKYEIVNGKLGLALVQMDFSRSSYYDEIDKAEFESLFR